MKKYNNEFKSMIVELYKNGRSVKNLSRKYGVSEVTIYKWIKQSSPIASINDTDITLEEIKCIKEIYFESKCRYGAIKVHHQLIKEGFSVSLKRVQRLMKSEGLTSIIQKKYPLYKQSKELVLERDNILEQDFSTIYKLSLVLLT